MDLKTTEVSLNTPKMTEAEDPLIGKMVGGRFRIVSLLGAGGMGTVYRAEQTAVSRPVVLKFLHPHLFSDSNLIERFHREALAASQLSCPNTIVLFDFGQTDWGTQYMAMEYLEGQSLSDVIRHNGVLPPLRVIGIVLQILLALEEAHEKGIVHRDLKPDNIMLVQRYGTSDFVKVLDFGIAKLIGKSEKSTLEHMTIGRDIDVKEGLTQRGTIFGSPGYMAPEQILCQDIDHRVDLYAMGVILYEMLSGHRPFRSTNYVELLRQTVDGKIESLSITRPDLELPKSLDLLILKCLQQDPDCRPASASELSEELRAISPTIVEHQQEQEKALLELVGIKRRWPRRMALWIGPLVFVLALGSGTLWLSLSERGPEDGTALAPGQRLFVSASTAHVPIWVTNTGPKTGVVGRVKGVSGKEGRKRALDLARAEVFATLADVPSRFDPQREKTQYLKELDQVLMHVQRFQNHQDLLPIKTFWAKFVEGRTAGAKQYFYDGYAYTKQIPPKLAVELRKLFADLRYDRYSFLTDQAVNRKRCDRATTMSEKVKEAIEQLPKKKEQKKRLRFILKLRLKQCLRSAEK